MDVKAFLPNKKNLPMWLLGGATTVGIVFYQRHKNSATTTPPVDATSTDASTADSTTYDPSQYDLSSDMGGYYGGGSGGYYSPYDYNNLSSTGYQSTISAAPTTDQQWTVDAETYLTNQGSDPIAAGLALGKYLLKQNVSQDQANLITSALAGVGYPPQSGPLPIHIAPTSQTPSAPPALPKVADGYYRDMLSGAIWLVSSEVRHHVGPSAWTKIEKTSHPKVTSIITATSPIGKLPIGSPIS